MKLIRAFICINFPNEIIKEVARIQNLINNKKFTGKLTELENLHLTLKFLGELNKTNLDKVKTLLLKINVNKFEARLQETGIFSFRKNPRIVWIRIGGPDTLSFQKKIDNSLVDLFPHEQRFMSHLTIARIKYVKDKQAFKDYIKDISVKPIKFNINSFQLKSSELTSFGPIYKTIKTYKLK